MCGYLPCALTLGAIRTDFSGALLLANPLAGPPSVSPCATQQVAVMVPSLLGSVEQGAGRYTFHLYVGYDEGDPVFDNASALAKLRRARPHSSPPDKFSF